MQNSVISINKMGEQITKSKKKIQTNKFSCYLRKYTMFFQRFDFDVETVKYLEIRILFDMRETNENSFLREIFMT